MCDDLPMPDANRRTSAGLKTCVVAPTLRRARRAVRALRGHGEERLEPTTLTGFLSRRRACAVILCPDGKDLARDLAFLHEAHERALWRAPGDEMQAAIAGLRGDPVGPPSARIRRPAARVRSLALLLEGVVRAERARRALTCDARHWIVESPFAVRLGARELKRLAKSGISWFALEPVRVRALLASPELARARNRWRKLLPARTRVIVLKP